MWHSFWPSPSRLVVLFQSIVGIIPLQFTLVAISCYHPCFWNLNSSVPVDVVRVKSCVNSLFNSMRVPVRVLVNKLIFVPERIILGLIGMFWSGRSLSSWKPYIPIMLLNLLMNAPSHFANEHFAAFTRRNLIHYTILFSWINRIRRSY